MMLDYPNKMTGRTERTAMHIVHLQMRQSLELWTLGSCLQCLLGTQSVQTTKAIAIHSSQASPAPCRLLGRSKEEALQVRHHLVNGTEDLGPFIMHMPWEEIVVIGNTRSSSSSSSTHRRSNKESSAMPPPLRLP